MIKKKPLNKVLLQLGGNVGDVVGAFEKAIATLQLHRLQLVAQSHLYESEPWGFNHQNWFLNQVIELNTQLNPDALLALTQQIERDLGRHSKSNNGNYEGRCIDIDILFYNDEIIDKPNLTIPHPKIQLRKFVLIPLCDHWGHHVHPQLNQTMLELLIHCTDALVVRRH